MNKLKILPLWLCTIYFAEAQLPISHTSKFVNASVGVGYEQKIIPSKNSCVYDFDFLSGEWDLHSKLLKTVWSQVYPTDGGKPWERKSTSRSKTKLKGSIASDTFMPGIISTDSLEFNAAFSPDGNYFYFSRTINKRSKIYVSKKNGSIWSTPEATSFSTENYSDADAAFSPAGELYFISDRPRNVNDTTKDYDIWKVSPLPGNQWSGPINVIELNSEKNEFYISFTKSGGVYFSSSREGGYGEEDIYYCENKNNTFGPPQNLGNKINSIHSEYDPFCSFRRFGINLYIIGKKR